MKYAISLLLGAVVTQSPAIAQVNYNLGLKSEVFYSTLDEDMGANFSHIWSQVDIGNVSLDEILANSADNNANAWRINTKFSGLPALLRGSTEEKIEENVFQDISLFVDASIAANPDFDGLPESVIKATREKQISQTLNLTMMEVSNRLDEIELDTSIQEVLFRRAWATSENSSLVLDFGKGALHSTFTTSDNASLLPDRALTAGGTIGTIYLSLHQSTVLDVGAVQAEIMAFKTRSAWFNAQEYISTVVNMEEQAFDDHKDLVDLNSGMIKAALSRGSYSLSASVAHHADMGEQDGGYEFTLSGTYDFANGHHIQATAFDAKNNARSGVENAYSFLYEVPISQNLDVYGNVTGMNGFDNRFTQERETDDGQSYGLGANFTFFSTENCQAVFETEIIKYDGILGNETDTLIGAVLDCSLF